MARTSDSGYGWEHQQLRESWRPAVEAGQVDCARCGEPIFPGALWDLGHDDHDRTVYRGPEHRACNRGASARALNSSRRQRELCWCGGGCLVHEPADAI
jgi:hypothetical protein